MREAVPLRGKGKKKMTLILKGGKATGMWIAMCCACSFLANAQIPQQPGLADWGEEMKVAKAGTELREPLVLEAKSDFLLLNEVADLEGAIGRLAYEKADGKGTRFYLRRGAGQSIGHMWHFKPMDFRNRTVKIYYSGMAPQRMTFEFYRSETSRKFSEEFTLETGSTTKMVEFTVPDEYPFRDVTNFAMRIRLSDGGRSFADFYIERIEVL